MSEFEGRGGGGAATGVSGEKTGEVAGAVAAALAALREAGEKFRVYEAHHAQQSVIPGADKQERAEKAIENGRLAQMCGGAAADLETALAEGFRAATERKARPAKTEPDVFYGFAVGWGARGAAYEYTAKEEHPEGTPVPACEFGDALAVFRAQLAKGVV